MRQIIINDELIGDEQLYYYQNDNGWYYCKYFAFREEYCYIDTNRNIKQSFCFQEKEILPNYYCRSYDISFKTIKGKKYTLFKLIDTVYKIPFDYYNNIIETLYCDVYAYDNITSIETTDKPLIFMYNDKIIGWIEPCAFEIYSGFDDDYFLEQDCKLIPKEITENAIFKDVMIFKKGFARVVFDDFCAKLDSKGNIIQKLKCEDCWFYDEYTAIKINNKWGAIDLSNNMIIQPKYDNLNYLKNNFWEITINDKKGIIDTTGNIVFPTIYDNFSYVDDNYIIAEKNDLCGVINYSGKIILPFKYNKLSFSQIKRKNNYLYATENHKMGIIDINGNVIIPYIYKKLIYLNKNTISAKIDDNKYILINEKNKQICSQIFEDIHSNYDNTDIYPAKINGLWGFIDDLGNTKLDFKYTDATQFNKGYCDVSINENPDFFADYGLINKEGTLVLDYKYSKYGTFIIDKDRFIVEQDEKEFIIDKKGTVIVDKPYTYIIPIASNGLLPIELDNGYKGFIDRNGNPLKINKETLNIPAIKINYDIISQKEKIKLIFGGEEL